MRKQAELACPFQTIDNYGYLCCVARDGSIGYCDFRLCPRKLWQIRRVMRQIFAGGLRIRCDFNPELMKAKRWGDAAFNSGC